MYPKNMFFASESVTEGHPDKLCDHISALFDVAKLVRDLSHDIGYTAPVYGFDVNTRAVVRTIHAQFQSHVQAVVRTTERSKRTIEMRYGGAVWEELQQPY